PPPMRPLDASGRGAAGPRSSTLSPVAGPGGPARPGAAGPIAPVPGPAGARAGGVGPGAAPARSVGLQPVLAGAGAGLLAVAAVVFVFFTFADDLALRALVTGVVTALTVGAAMLLRSRGLRSSAEAVAALAVVLALVDVELALSAWALDPVGASAARATLLAVVLVGLGVVGERARVRAWVTGAVVLGPLVPLVAAPAAQASWGWAVALLVTACLTAVAGPVTAAAGARVGGRLGAERGFLGVVRTVAVLLAVLVGLTVPAPPELPGGAGAALVALGAALVATLLRVTTGERRWYAVGGAAAVLAGALLGTGVGVGFVGLAPALGALAWVVVLVLTGRSLSAGVLRAPVPAVGRSDALLGGAVVVLVMAGPALALAGLRAAEVLVTLTAGTSTALDDAPLGVGILSAGLAGEGTARGTVGATLLDGTLVGLLSVLVVLLVAARLLLRTPRTAPPLLGGAPRLGTAPLVVTGRALAPWAALALVLTLVLDPRLAGVTSLVLLALLAAALLVATARPAPVAAPAGADRSAAAA
ncbi:hypothetical protein DBB34_20210, partial [Sphaerisporangium cinnabarinum]